jgi:hypothetical protein
MVKRVIQQQRTDTPAFTALPAPPSSQKLIFLKQINELKLITEGFEP